MRKLLLLTLVAAIVIGAVVARCLFVPHEALTFKFVDAFNGQPLEVTAAIDEHVTASFPALETIFQRLSLFRVAPPSKRTYAEGRLKLRLAKHPRRQTRIVCSSPFHQTAVVLYCNGTNRLDAIGLGSQFTNYASYILNSTSGVVRVPLYRFSGYPLN